MMTIVNDIKNIQRVAERLHGIVIGISIDHKLRDAEIMALNDWLETHEDLHHMEPFRSAVLVVKRCLADLRIDEDEREEILGWCLQFDSEFSLPDVMIAAIRRLNGILNGIAIDGVVNEGEILGLSDWLQDYVNFKHHWPFSPTWVLVGQILEDGKVTEEEKNELLAFCNRFTEQVPDTSQAQEKTGAEPERGQILKPFEKLCDRDSKITFEGKRFCFTGPAKAGSRKEVHEIVKSLRGIPTNRVDTHLDYLVIGSLSSPCWAYSLPESKIEKVLEYRRKGQKIEILHEDDFIAQANTQK